jgi:hypothetical protein
LSGTIFRFCALACLAAPPAFAQIAVAPFSGPLSGITTDTAVREEREPKADFGREIEASKSYAIPAAEIVGFEILLNRVDNAHYGCCDYRVTMDTVRRNLRSSWVVDRDPFLVNQLGHPYQGAMFHGIARASGLNFWEGFAYAFAGSVLWKIAGENTLPSRNDQITTSVGGPVLGEVLFRLSNLVLERGGLPAGWREAAAAVISPPVGFNRYAFGDRFRHVYPSRDPLYFTRMQLGFSGSQRGHLGFSTADVRRNEALADFSIEYGLPGKKDYDYSRPFDYFSFQATASSANGFENVMTRGMLVGKALETAKSYRGIWGLYGMYDYIAPQTFRVSSTGLALGTTSQWRVSDSMQVLGTVLVGGGYTAAGTVLGSNDLDYHHGMAPQALAALRLIFGTRAAIDVTGREYYISRLGAAQRGGHENIVRFDAALTVRVHRQHGVTLKYLGNRRDANYPDLGDRTQRRQTIGLFYTLLGHDRFGAADWD